MRKRENCGKDRTFTAIHQLIEKQVNLNPDAPAITYRGKNLSYNELNAKANQLAHYLINKGIKPETLIGVSVRRSIEMVICILAILKAGGAYIPIDPDYPIERINYMVTNSDIGILLTENKLLPHQNEIKNIARINIDSTIEQLSTLPTSNPNFKYQANHLAYVLYTSGSTGGPKGVMVTHQNLIHAFYGWKEVYQLVITDCHLQMANFAFDVFAGDLIRALCSGSKLVICPKEYLLKPDRLYGLMLNEKITCAEFVPTVLRKLVEHIEKYDLNLNFMRLLICGSDNWSMREYRTVQKLCGEHTRVINSYGLTETTIDSTYFENNLSGDENFTLDHSVPIGIPFPNNEILLLDENLKSVAHGEYGEIFIGGPGLARGYFNQPELTRRKFISHPFNMILGARLYKTGDLGRLLPDGNIEFLGRIDNQIKLRGMRIEISDIENVINSNPNVRESLVIVTAEKTKHKKLAAYIVFHKNSELSISELRKFLQKKLPSYMVPSVFISLTSLPLTANGKLDRRALKNKIELSKRIDYETNYLTKVNYMFKNEAFDEAVSTT